MNIDEVTSENLKSKKPDPFSSWNISVMFRGIESEYFREDDIVNDPARARKDGFCY